MLRYILYHRKGEQSVKSATHAPAILATVFGAKNRWLQFFQLASVEVRQ